ncbi:MAG: hypothetical protein HKO66_04935 [Saprospiraceae bacterium]|nr:hypothetical protein [Bacteroidia bacterium]NNL91557.1 hypothetical protein [Saprospiraceae bacterium]
MRQSIYLFAVLFLFSINLFGQQKPQKIYLNPDVIQGELVKVTGPLRDFVAPPFDGDIVKDEKLGYHPKSDWILNDSINPNAKPAGLDPAWQKSYAPPRGPVKALNQSYNGQGYSSVNPPDPAMDVSPVHVIQMINGSGGSTYQIYDRTNGNTVAGPTAFDSFTGINGAGDPIVIYDQLADKWLMSEFSSSGNMLVVAISQTNDPTGSWYVYSYTAPQFPDYPKYAMWPDSYVVTSNESSPAVYALDRDEMLIGNPGTMQRFTVPPYGTIGFQAMTPVDLDGNTLPPANEPAIVMRMADDAWDVNLNQDQLELFEFDIDFTTPANTTLTQTLTLQTASFDTHLCGYTSFSCIDQQGSGINLDPLREVLMNKIHYRRFPTHETMVMSHVTDVTGNDDAGVRWYELRRTTGDWSIYQQGTYSPDTESRWMSSIAINGDGSIGLAYNTSSATSFPSVKFTGRKECDPLGTMTEPETVMAQGTAANGSNRYGDYAAMSVDPVDGSFWFTGEYNPASQWSTIIGNFDIGTCTPQISFSTSSISVNEQDADIVSTCLDYLEVGVTISLNLPASIDPTVTLSLSGSAIQDVDYEAPSVLTATLTPTNLSETFVFKVFNDAYVESLEDIIVDYTLNANGGDATAGSSNQTLTIDITSDDSAPSNVSGTVVLVDEDFETNTLGVFTTDNPSGDTPFQVGDEATAETGPFDIPAPPIGTYMAYVNDDDCDCNQNQVDLISPVFDLTGAVGAELSFDYYYEDNTWQGDQEDADVYVSINGGTSYTQILDLPASSATAFTNEVIDLTPYIGEANVRILFRYSDGTGWLYGFVIDNVEITGDFINGVQIETNTAMPAEEYLGPNATVHFYDPTSDLIMLTITNNSTHDFGCTTVEVDRAGTTPTALEFNSAVVNDYVASKTFKITPDNASSSASYDIELYYEEAEILAWENTTGETRSVLDIVKVSGNNQISDVTPANAGSFDINYFNGTIGAFNSDVIISASIPSGFSGFGIGRPSGSGGGCTPGTNTWVGPLVGDWHASPVNWSLGVLPDYCHDVVIPNGNDIDISAGQIGKANTLDVVDGAELTVDVNGELDVIAPN